MKKVLISSFITTILLFSGKNSFAQQNMVPNPGFETITDINHVCDNTATHGAFGQYDDNKDYWSKVAHWDTPNRSSIVCGVGSPDVSCDFNGSSWYVRTGAYAARGSQCEYLTVKLTEKMVVDQWYYVEYYILNSSDNSVSLDSYGIHFSEDKVKQCLAGDCRINESPHVEVPSSLTLQPREWYQVSKYFKADEEYEWLLIGNYGNTIATIYWDDFIIYHSDCPPEQKIQNKTYTANGFTLQAENTIRAGNNVGAGTSSGNVVVAAGADITYTAEDEISLEDGFEAVEGTEFEAKHAPCDPVISCTDPIMLWGTQSNVFSPGGVIDELKVEISKANTFSIIVNNRWGDPVYKNTGTVTSFAVAVWDGSCNVSDNCLSSLVRIPATYVVNLTFENCRYSWNKIWDVYVAESNNKTSSNTITTPKMDDLKLDSLIRKNLRLFPNPTSGHFTLLIPSYENSPHTPEIVLTDLMGRIIYKKRTKDSQLELDLSSRAKGVYFVKVQTGDQVLVEKVVLQ